MARSRHRIASAIKPQRWALIRGAFVAVSSRISAIGDTHHHLSATIGRSSSQRVGATTTTDSWKPSLETILGTARVRGQVALGMQSYTPGSRCPRGRGRDLAGTTGINMKSIGWRLRTPDGRSVDHNWAAMKIRRVGRVRFRGRPLCVMINEDELQVSFEDVTMFTPTALSAPVRPLRERIQRSRVSVELGGRR
jgi:hypothetical protein